MKYKITLNKSERFVTVPRNNPINALSPWAA